ncbi:hypothetical protein BC941DRAFT_475946 [Chlamydoabsidia padenii]|nr:hypothetical protein BC941DRAFT_475946 [Chlamydoabsidia padenii]
MLSPHPAETIVAFEVAYQKFEDFNNQPNDIWDASRFIVCFDREYLGKKENWCLCVMVGCSHTVATGNLENINANILDLYNQIDELNKEKRVKNMASAVSMDCGQAYSTLLLANKYSPLLQELENDNEKAKRLMKFHTMKTNASNIN